MAGAVAELNICLESTVLNPLDIVTFPEFHSQPISRPVVLRSSNRKGTSVPSSDPGSSVLGFGSGATQMGSLMHEYGG